MNLLQYLNQLPTDLDGVNVRELALKNYDKDFYDGWITIYDFEDAICCAFKFEETPEKEEFWYDIARKLRGVKPIDNQIKMEI